MAIQLTELQSMLDDLKRAKYSGQTRVRFSDGREVDYGSVDQLQKAIADLNGEIAATASPSTQSSYSLTSFSRE